MTARWIVCEKTGSWAMVLRWSAGSEPGPWLETRSLPDCRAALEEWPASLLFIEVTGANGEQVLQMLWGMPSRFPQARAVILGTRELEASADLFREAGALDVALSPRRADRLVRLARWHLAHVARPRRSAREAIWSRLPWSKK